MKRRTLLKLAGASLLLPSPVWAGPDQGRLVVVLLRGALDGLAAVAPIGDPAYSSVRGALALDDGPRLDETFALHPALADLLPLWPAGQLLAVHATGLPEASRSHFDAQDLLETGGGRDGWLSRALTASGREGLALGTDLPLLLRGEGVASSLDPEREVPDEDEVLALIARLYDHDPLLGPALQASLRTREELDVEPAERTTRRETDISRTARVAAALLRAEHAPSALVVDTGGWDTHARQQNRLDGLLGQLGAGLATLAAELGPIWSHTTVVVVTEFGRTARPNGTGGTDHGTGSCALVLGGSVRGGRVLGDWPGLRDLHEGRDLRATTDLRAVLRGALLASIGGDEAFPDVEPLLLT